MELASRTLRLLGQLLDGVIAMAPIVIAFIIAGMSQTVGHVLIVAALCFTVAYYLFGDALPGGGSYAKQLLNLEVVDATTGRPCTIWQSFIRNLLLAVLGPIDWIFIFGSRHQRLGDMAAGTIVRVAARRGATTGDGLGTAL
jgi:uncharacterized RDD family membrane protein YckC